MDLEPDMLEKLKICSLLHDIGKIATPKEILNKDAKLTVSEWLEIRRHPEVGAEILRELKQFKDVIQGIRYHHEHWDGSKGIFGLKCDEIPLMARILSVADAFDALTSDRPYRPKKSKEDAIEEIGKDLLQSDLPQALFCYESSSPLFGQDKSWKPRLP